MSTDIIVYSPSEALLPCEELSRLLLPSGWILLFVQGDGPDGLLTAGVLASGYIYGAHKPDVASRLRDCIKKGDDEAIERLGEEEDVAGCEFLAVAPYSFVEAQGEDAFREWTLGGEAELGPSLRAAKSEYTLTIRGANTESASLQMSLARAIASVTRGLRCDPQSGRFVSYSTGSARTLKKGEVPAEIEALERLANQAGLPVDEEGVQSDRMTPSQVEQYLSLCQKHPSGVFYNVLLELTIDELRRVVRRSGDPERVAWFERLQATFPPRQLSLEDLLGSA